MTEMLARTLTVYQVVMISIGGAILSVGILVFSMLVLIIVLLLKLRNIIGLQHNRGRGAGKLTCVCVCRYCHSYHNW